jgi:CxxC-x17-CxxC domain-containing protein
MPYGENQGGFSRKMFTGNWKCSKCGKEITELPFEPDPARLDQLLCRDCHRERRQAFRGGRSFER